MRLVQAFRNPFGGINATGRNARQREHRQATDQRERVFRVLHFSFAGFTSTSSAPPIWVS
jgi:hypothetical protein